MTRLRRPDGVELHTEERGDGPVVVLAPYWSGNPGVYEGLLAELARDHRVISFDARGTGQSTRMGPYDMATDCADLEAILDHAAGAAAVLSVADGCNRAVRVAAARPDLVGAVIAFGVGPFARMHFEGREAMIGSDAVVDAFLEMCERDYRGALRTALSATNDQMDEEELRERVAGQLSYSPQEAALARVRGWAEDDPTDAARKTGERLWIFSAPDVAGAWLPPLEERRHLIQTLTPRAHLEEAGMGQGPVSRPDLAAQRIRRVTAALRLESSR
jgi:pimeloyl-ACP methyl ester carboxylesterase